MRPEPNKPEPTAVGAGRSPVAVHFAGRRRRSFLVRCHSRAMRFTTRFNLKEGSFYHG